MNQQPAGRNQSGRRNAHSRDLRNRFLSRVQLASLVALIWQPAVANVYSFEMQPSTSGLNYEMMAERIVGALKLQQGERVLIRFDPGYFNELVLPLRKRIRAAGAIDLAAVEYAETSALRDTTNTGSNSGQASFDSQTHAFEQLLESVDVYLWLPVRERARQIAPHEAVALGRWLDKGGARRQIHFHWSAGSVLADGLAGEHSPGFDAVYEDAVQTDHAALSATQDRAIALLRSGTVRVRTPAGTDISFRVGDRPFNKQNGDASPERMKTARVRIDREIELPAGVIRVAPLEETVNGKLVIPAARFMDKTARGIKLEISNGRVVRVQADENLAVVEAALASGGDAARSFREFALGFNAKLVSPAGSSSLAYYGYGAGVVRMSLGDNQELGGAVRGNFVRWFFFPDASVEVEGARLVSEGRLVAPR